ncbi:hypothetical protein [Deinococcus ficus]|uniref:Uncharacterized protein n=1 Tax=Deinococcus ficus TaxID=317577 RepID=A0A221T3F0_9DEIO|nr:hypothetical protein [Deinococcus ficus]ASN83432.1 hypothetical protein DFI_19740 [Deinococcus ficus]
MTQFTPAGPDSLTPLAPPRFWNERQSVHLDQTFVHRSGAKVRVNVVRDSVPFQSYARAEGFDPAAMTWNPIASIPHPRMTSRGLNGYEPAGNAAVQSQLISDSTELLRLAAQLLD